MSLDIPRIQGICFDVDGTLSDTDDLWVNRLEKNLSPARALFPRHSPQSFARWAVMAMEAPGNLLYWMLDVLRIDDDAGRILNRMSKNGRLRTRGPFWIIQAVKETLTVLNRRYPMAVVRGGEFTHGPGGDTGMGEGIVARSITTFKSGTTYPPATEFPRACTGAREAVLRQRGAGHVRPRARLRGGIRLVTQDRLVGASRMEHQRRFGSIDLTLKPDPAAGDGTAFTAQQVAAQAVVLLLAGFTDALVTGMRKR